MSIDRVSGSTGFNRPERLDDSPRGAETDRPSRDDGDRVELSADGRRVEALVKKAQQLPPVRQERVDEVRTSLDDGTYRVDARQLARALLDFEYGRSR